MMLAMNEAKVRWQEHEQRVAAYQLEQSVLATQKRTSLWVLLAGVWQWKQILQSLLRLGSQVNGEHKQIVLKR